MTHRARMAWVTAAGVWVILEVVASLAMLYARQYDAVTGCCLMLLITLLFLFDYLWWTVKEVKSYEKSIELYKSEVDFLSERVAELESARRVGPFLKKP